MSLLGYPRSAGGSVTNHLKTLGEQRKEKYVWSQSGEYPLQLGEAWCSFTVFWLELVPQPNAVPRGPDIQSSVCGMETELAGASVMVTVETLLHILTDESSSNS